MAWQQHWSTFYCNITGRKIPPPSTSTDIKIES